MRSKPKQLRTPAVRCSFVSLITPRAINADSTPFYQMMIVIPKDDGFIRTLATAIRKLAVDEFGKGVKFRSPLKDGDEMPNVNGAEDCICFNAKSKFKVSVIDKKGALLEDEDQVYSGAHYSAIISLYAWTHPTGGRGISVNLLSVLKAKDDEAFTSRVNPHDAFGDMILKENAAVEEGDEDEEEEEKPRPKRKSRTKPKPPVVEDDDEEEEEPKPKSKSRKDEINIDDLI